MQCCIKCFNDQYLIDLINAQGRSDKCDFCGAEGAPVLEAIELRDAFDQLFSLYEPAERGHHYIVDPENEFQYEGISLAECISDKDGWSIFSDDLDTAKQNDLLDEIRFGDLRPKEQIMETQSDDWWARIEDSYFRDRDESIWNNFSDHIKRKRRFLPKPDESEYFIHPSEWLPDLLGDIVVTAPCSQDFFRARIGGIDGGLFGIVPFTRDQMSAPLPEQATRGRANPAGIAYLYVADQEETAVAEIRPYVGANVTVAKICPTKNLRVIDLTKIHKIPSPFGHDNLKTLITRNALLNTLNKELARPVNPEDGEVEYVPTQYLAEIVLNNGYDGIRYRSAVSASGTNYVFFTPVDLAITAEPKLVTVRSMQIEYR